MTARLIKNSWWVDFSIDGTRYRKRSPENSRTGALAYEATLRHKLARGEGLYERASDANARNQIFEQFAWTWFKEYVQSNNKYSEQRAKRYVLQASLIPFFGRMRIDQIGVQHIERYKARALREGAGPKTVNNRLTILRKCLTTAYDWLALDGQPPKIVWLKCPPPQTDHLTPDECALLLSHADGVVRELVLTALRTGMRQGELKGLQWPSIDWENRSLTVRHSRCDYTQSLGSPKSNRERHIPLDEEVRELLSRRKASSGYVFLDGDGKPFDHKRLNRRLTTLCKRAGLRKIGWHALRHTFASHLVTKGVPINAVQTLMGHSNVTVTMRYAHLAPSTLRTAIDLLRPEPAIGGNFGQPAGNPWLELHRQEASQNRVSLENA